MYLSTTYSPISPICLPSNFKESSTDDATTSHTIPPPSAPLSLSESHPCAHTQANSHQITSLRKNRRGVGVQPRILPPDRPAYPRLPLRSRNRRLRGLALKRQFQYGNGLNWRKYHDSHRSDSRDRNRRKRAGRAHLDGKHRRHELPRQAFHHDWRSLHPGVRADGGQFRRHQPHQRHCLLLRRLRPKRERRKRQLRPSQRQTRRADAIAIAR
jgi:hypothetical protein